VADADRDVELVGELLQLVLPYVRSIAVAAASVGGDEDLFRLRVALRSNLILPRLDRCDREHRRVVMDAHVHEAVVEASSRPSRSVPANKASPCATTRCVDLLDDQHAGLAEAPTPAASRPGSAPTSDQAVVEVERSVTHR
jgi:hypothetical protein